jgi:hypothetical protein
MNSADEAKAVARRYASRNQSGRYSILRPDVWQSLQERQRAEWQLWAHLNWTDLSQRRYTEVGCGAGRALLEALRAGFFPGNLTSLELLPERYEIARQVLPPTLMLSLGDAASCEVSTGSFVRRGAWT